MKARNILLYFIIFISCNTYSQKLFKELGSREYSNTLNTKLLRKVCDNLEIKFSDVYLDKSHSINFKTDKTFFVLQYIIKKAEDGNLNTTKYLFVDNLNGSVIDHFNDKESFFDNEAIQPSPSYILKNKIKFNDRIIGIGIITEEAVRSCATLYSQQKLTIISLSNNKITNLLDKYTIRKTNGESNCSGTYEIEILDTSIDLLKNKTNGVYDLSVTKVFSYKNVIEENHDKNIKGTKIVENKTETEKLEYNGKSYNFEKDNVLRFLK